MSAAPGPARPARARLVSPEMYETVLGTVYTGLATNVVLALACLPTLVLLAATDPATSWPLLALTAPLVAPALTGTFAVFARFSADGSTEALRTFWRAYSAHFRRSLAVGTLAVGLVVVLGVDIVAVWGMRAGAAVIPVLVVLIVLVVSSTVVALVAVPELPGSRLRDLLRASVFLAVRRWYLSAGSLLVLATLAAVVAARPAVGLGFAAAPLLYVVWGGSRFALRAGRPAAS